MMKKVFRCYFLGSLITSMGCNIAARDGVKGMLGWKLNPQYKQEALTGRANFVCYTLCPPNIKQPLSFRIWNPSEARIGLVRHTPLLLDHIRKIIYEFCDREILLLENKNLPDNLQDITTTEGGEDLMEVKKIEKSMVNIALPVWNLDEIYPDTLSLEGIKVLKAFQDALKYFHTSRHSLPPYSRRAIQLEGNKFIIVGSNEEDLMSARASVLFSSHEITKNLHYGEHPIVLFTFKTCSSSKDNAAKVPKNASLPSRTKVCGCPGYPICTSEARSLGYMSRLAYTKVFDKNFRDYSGNNLKNPLNPTPRRNMTLWGNNLLVWNNPFNTLDIFPLNKSDNPLEKLLGL